jgi:hypothetical protein
MILCAGLVFLFAHLREVVFTRSFTPVPAEDDEDGGGGRGNSAQAETRRGLGLVVANRVQCMGRGAEEMRTIESFGRQVSGVCERERE